MAGITLEDLSRVRALILKIEGKSAFTALSPEAKQAVLIAVATAELLGATQGDTEL